jgi:hypothetical protein
MLLSISKTISGKIRILCIFIVIFVLVIAIVLATEMDIDVTKQVSWISIIYIHRLHLFVHIISVLVSTIVKIVGT